jgi:hypothetical protein
MESGYCCRKSIENANSFTESINDVCASTRPLCMATSCEAPDISIGDALLSDKPCNKCRDQSLTIDVASAVFLQQPGRAG